jgi:hypothetical protein
MKSQKCDCREGVELMQREDAFRLILDETILCKPANCFVDNLTTQTTIKARSAAVLGSIPASSDLLYLYESMTTV